MSARKNRQKRKRRRAKIKRWLQDTAYERMTRGMDPGAKWFLGLVEKALFELTPAQKYYDTSKCSDE